MMRFTVITLLLFSTIGLSAQSLNNHKHKKVFNKLEHFNKVKSTGVNHTLLILENAWPISPAYGDEIAVFDLDGMLLASTVFTEGHTGLSIWGDDLFTTKTDGATVGAGFEISLWDRSENQEVQLVVNRWSKGNDVFTPNGISVAVDISTLSSESNNMEVSLYPNPANEYSYINFFVDQRESIEIRLLNKLGQVERILPHHLYEEGSHRELINTGGLLAGVYIVVIDCEIGQSEFKLCVE